MKLYNFFRSSASYRVRIAMALKGLSYDNASINLAKGEQHQASYGAVNPQEIVPTLDDNGNDYSVAGDLRVPRRDATESADFAA
jgi:glutathione S-transferase